MGLGESGHDHGPEVLGVENDDLVVVVLSLIMVCSATEEVGLFVGSAGFVVKGEMIFS